MLQASYTHQPLMEATLRPRTILAAATALAAAAAAVLATSGAASASIGPYAALGDSYSSGVGAGSYSGGSCDRSAYAYGQLWANANSPSSFDFAACSGARTSDIVNTEAPTLSSSTVLVSLTIGGNDVNFASTMETCVEDFWTDSSCLNAISADEQAVQTTLPAALDSALNAITQHAPSAKVVLLDYPHFYDLSQSSGCIGLDTTERTAVDNGIDMLDTAIQAAASRHGAYFADVRNQFAGHEICDGSSWLNSVNIFDIDSSYHPTQAGQQDGYYPVFKAAATAVGV